MRFGRSDRHPMTGNRMSSEEAAEVHGFERHSGCTPGWGRQCCRANYCANAAAA